MTSHVREHSAARAVAAVFGETSSAWTAGDADAFSRWCADGASAILPGDHLRDHAEVLHAPGETEPPTERWELATWTLSKAGDQWPIGACHSCPAAEGQRAAGVGEHRNGK